MSAKQPKPRVGSTQPTGVYKADSVKDTADILNITISDTVAGALASDVEYRIHQVIEEAARFMRHGRRTTITTADIDLALRVLNIEPLYGHSAHNPPTFRRALPFPNMSSAGPVYFVEDEEIDFDRVLREEKITLPKGVSWTAHWLAVEGVQPLIPENPPAIPRDADYGGSKNGVLAQATQAPAGTNTTGGTTAGAATAGAGGATALVNGTSSGLSLNNAAAVAVKKQQEQQHQHQQQQLVKQVLSKELQLYYTKLTSLLLPPPPSDSPQRAAALSSLRSDAGLQALLPYLIRWVGEGVVGSLKEDLQSENDGRVLEVYSDVISALLENTTLFIEPYLHQILPPILSILLHSTLPPSHATHLRTSAAQTLSRLLTQHSTTYPSLSPRIMKTLLLALIAPGKSQGTREGAIRGLIGVGKEAVIKGLLEGGGAKLIGDECTHAGESADALVASVMGALQVVHPPADMADSLDANDPTDAVTIERLRHVLGDFFAQRVNGDAAWARAIVEVSGYT